MEIIFDVISEYGEKILVTTLRDNGSGMDQRGLQSFFDLGNSLSREKENAIGEKGHGTKVYLNSAKIEVLTVCDGMKYNALMESPIKKLHDRKVPEVTVTYDATDEDNGTTIIITGYNNNRREKFTHAILKDYIKWFTKMGSVELEFGLKNNENVILILKGIDQSDTEEIKFGHFFPEKSKSVDALFNEHLVDAPKWYCNRIIRSGNLENFPEIKYDAVFYIEGTKVKYDYNPMIRRSGYTAPKGAYTIQERYGLWLCKDYIPVQRKNEWITQKGSEYTRFHAFINCQDLRLTANRGSVDNTPFEILDDIKKVVEEIYTQIIQSDDWRNLEWLESEVTSYNTIQNEKKDFKWRLDRVKLSKIADYNGVRLVEPRRESGVFSLFMMLDFLDPNLFPFTVIDYDTHSALDFKRNDLSFKGAFLNCTGCTLMAHQGQLITLFPGNTILLSHVFSGDTHMTRYHSVKESIINHGVFQLASIHPIPHPGFQSQIGGIGHTFHSDYQGYIVFTHLYIANGNL